MGQAIGCGAKAPLNHNKPLPSVELDDPHPKVSTNPNNNFADGDGNPQIRMIIVTISYAGSEAPLVEASKDGEHMKALAAMCGVRDLTIIQDKEATKERLLAAIEDVGSRCDADDIFIFYYCGHGSGVPDLEGEELDGQDEVLCTVDENYEISPTSVTTDDEFCEAIIEHVPEETRCLLLIDACNSGTICDMNNGDWGTERQAICMSGCDDNQTSAGWPDMGSLMTSCLQIALEDFKGEGKEEYSVGEVYNATVEAKESRFNQDGEYPQKISLQCSPGFKAGKMLWPLIPPGEYKSAATKLGY